MSNSIYPTLAGLGFSVGKSPKFSTTVLKAVDGSELRGSFMPYPLWTFRLTYDVLRSNPSYNELQTLAGFFLSRKGMFDSFLFSDPDDSSVTDQTFGAGNGSATQFQLIRSLGNFSEPVNNVNTITNVKVAGNVTTAYTINANGLITFNAAPTGNLTWTGSYYFRCRFLEDTHKYEKFMYQLWQIKEVEFLGSPANLLGTS